MRKIVKLSLLRWLLQNDYYPDKEMGKVTRNRLERLEKIEMTKREDGVWNLTQKGETYLREHDQYIPTHVENG